MTSGRNRAGADGRTPTAPTVGGTATTSALLTRLGRRPAVLAPGVFDPLTALLVETAGFEAAYVSGASIAYTQLGRPDVGLVGLEHVADVVTRIRDRVQLPLIVDADTGFGNALNVQRTVRRLERAGASAIQIEDQVFPKRCGHLDGKAVIPTQEMAGKIAAAVDARQSDTLIIGRTDAAAIEGLPAALERAHAYLAAGADVLFIEAPRTEADLKAIVAAFGGKVPLLANMVEGGHTPLYTCDQLSAMGFALVISPGSLVRIMVPAAEMLLQALKTQGSSHSVREHMLDLAGVNARIGLAEALAETKRYDPS
jgi:2-methylisocitrate lyase-like PEP mutase family enzyme